MKVPIYFISDVHFKISNAPDEIIIREKMYKLFSKIKKTGGTLIIGGDFFDFWFDYKNFLPQEYKNIMLELKKLYNANIKIHYIAGNHDYWDFGFFKNFFGCEFYIDDFDFKVNNNNIKVTHGDGLLKNDNGYRLLKKILRNKLNIFLFKLIPPRIGYKIAKFVSNTSRHYNHDANYSKKIKSELISWRKLDCNNNYDVILMGHYHQNGIYKYNGKSLIFMGDWLSQFTVTKYDGQNWHQYSWNT